MITVLVVDDHAIVRHGLRLLLEAAGDIAVVGEAASGTEALEKMRALNPSVLLMDISMPDMDGYAATRSVTAQYPRVKVLVLTMHREPQRVAEMLRAGASGYLVKSAAPDELVTAVRAVARGESYLQPEVTATVIEGFVARKGGAGEPVLSEREREVVRAVAQGRSVRQIADDLFISPRTVQTHRQNAMKKLGVHNERELILYALRDGLVSLPPA